jgi:hypothetical protein
LLPYPKIVWSAFEILAHILILFSLYLLSDVGSTQSGFALDQNILFPRYSLPAYPANSEVNVILVYVSRMKLKLLNRKNLRLLPTVTLPYLFSPGFHFCSRWSPIGLIEGNMDL